MGCVDCTLLYNKHGESNKNNIINAEYLQNIQALLLFSPNLFIDKKEKVKFVSSCGRLIIHKCS